MRLFLFRSLPKLAAVEGEGLGWRAGLAELALEFLDLDAEEGGLLRSSEQDIHAFAESRRRRRRRSPTREPKALPAKASAEK